MVPLPTLVPSNELSYPRNLVLGRALSPVQAEAQMENPSVVAAVPSKSLKQELVDALKVRTPSHQRSLGIAIIETANKGLLIVQPRDVRRVCSSRKACRNDYSAF